MSETLKYSRRSSTDYCCEERIIYTLLLTVALIFGSFMLQTDAAYAATAQPAYSCSSPHCYGIVQWGGLNYSKVDGSSTTEDITYIQCGNCDGFVNNETWLLDATTKNCVDPDNPQNTHDICWVEAGYTTYGTPDHHKSPSCTKAPANCYFWADNRPGGGYTEHPVAQVLGTDYGSGGLYLFIDRASSNSFQVTLSTPHGTYQELSRSNNMQPDTIQVGEELYGTGGASSPTTDFYANEWYGTAHNEMHYQTNSGTGKQSSNPPYADWLNPPDPTNYGGVWYVHT